MTEAMVNMDRICRALNTFINKKERPKALLGFDGYIDKLVRPKRSQGMGDYFETVREFADFIGSMGATSSDIAVHCVFEKIGGNGTLLAEALADKGIPTACIGAMGDRELVGPYQTLQKKAALYSVCECATSYAFEFNDGKLMFGDTECFFQLDWERVVERVGMEELIRLFSESKLMGFANWSGLPMSTDLLEGLLRDACPKLPQGKERSIFFDLADPSGKSEQQFQELFSALKRLRDYYTVVVGLNPKECAQIYGQYFCKRLSGFDPQMGEALLAEFPADEIVIHAAGCAYAGKSGGALYHVPGRFLSQPRISVGAGDNFNSGYCLGKLMDLSPEDSAAIGNEAAVCFMEQENPATLEDLLAVFAEK